MKRLPNWERLLQQQFEHARTQQFAWGTFDCALFACDCVLAIGGVDPGAQFRGKYSDKESADRVIGSSGDLGAFAAGVAAAHGMAEVKSGFAGRGDVVLVDNAAAGAAQPSTALGIVDFSGRFAVCAGERGLLRVGMRRWLRAWKVG